MKSISIFKSLTCVALICIIASCKKNNNEETLAGQGKVNLEFENKVGDQELELNTGAYTNANGDDFKITTFKYRISNITFNKADGSKNLIPESYLLIDAADEKTTLQTIEHVPAGDYVSMDFVIGVDSVRNFAGAQTGALDPAKGMYWSWNTGYIFVMLEGSSSKSTQADNKLAFHVGGAKAPNNTVRKVTLPFTAGGLRVRSNSQPEIHLLVDAAYLFKGTTNINFATLSGFHGGSDAVTIANNYATGMFKLDHIHN
ncbi:MAG: hypothetical protein EAZ15_07285 [Sphingobacteriales bacterium]|nr:MAG: hypothetical protein EAZ15_07285 [Sphingobacteriales bacterium]